MRRTVAMALTLALVMSACTSTDATGPTDQASQAPPDSIAASTTTSPTTDVPSTVVPTEASRITPDIDPTAPLYENLELDTPEQAVESLIWAYDDRDFVRAWLIFDVDVQQRLARSLNNLDFAEFRSATFQLPNNVIEGSGEHASLNSVAMTARLFDDAANLGYLHVDLAGAAVESTDNASGSAAAVVTVRLSDNSVAQLRLIKTPTNRWRVNQIALDGVDFDDSGGVFLNASCERGRIRVHAGSECPSSDTTRDPAIDAEVERIRESAGDDVVKQIEAAQQIQALVAGATVESDENVCAALQGNALLPDDAVDDELLARAESLLENTCPGSIDLLRDPPAVPPSGEEIGDRTAYGRLDLSTPETAVGTFGELFTNEAFVLLFMSLDADAQNVLARSINNLDASTIADPKILDSWDGLNASEHIGVSSEIFATIMSEASENGLHLLDLSGPLEIVGTTSLQWKQPRIDPVEAQVVEARSDILGSVYFLMIESPSGRWRVRQVALDPAAFESLDNSGKVFIAS